LEGLYIFQSGSPLAFYNFIFIGAIRDIRIGPRNRTADRCFDTYAGFERDSARALAFNVRTFPLRFSGVRGHAMNNWDLSILKNTRMGDRTSLQFRGEFLNAMNRVWLASPNTTPTSSLFGSVTSEQGYMRRVQVGVKVLF
jgi:hypothetical protein